MKPNYLMRVPPSAFNSETACLGEHLAAIVRMVATSHPDLHWFASDVHTVDGELQNWSKASPHAVGATDILANAVQAVTQFESGVFVAVPSGNQTPFLREGGLWTEDPEDADIGDALVEIRTFDTTYISVSTSDDRVHAIVTATLQVEHPTGASRSSA